MIQRYFCTGINYSHEKESAPFLAGGFRALDLLYLADHKPLPIPAGTVLERPRLDGDVVCRLHGQTHVFAETALRRLETTEVYSSAKAAPPRTVTARQVALAKNLGVPVSEVASAYRILRKTRALPNRLRLGYVFAEVMRRFRIDTAEEVWLTSLIEPLTAQLEEVLRPGVTVFLCDSSAWYSRLVQELCRLAGASATFLDAPLYEGLYRCSCQPLWETPDNFEPGEGEPTEDEVRKILADGTAERMASEQQHPLLRGFLEARKMASDLTPSNSLPALRRTSFPMGGAQFGEALRWVPRAAEEANHFDFGFFGEDENDPSVICAESKLATAIECCVELSAAYRRERILFRPHPNTPCSSLVSLYRCPNVFLSNWSDEEMLRSCGEIVSRTATNGLVAEFAGADVLWASNVFYRNFDLGKVANQGALVRFCNANFQSAEQILDAHASGLRSTL